jgi:hypothetical protein
VVLWQEIQNRIDTVELGEQLAGDTDDGAAGVLGEKLSLCRLADVGLEDDGGLDIGV